MGMMKTGSKKVSRRDALSSLEAAKSVLRSLGRFASAGETHPAMARLQAERLLGILSVDVPKALVGLGKVGLYMEGLE